MNKVFYAALPSRGPLGVRIRGLRFLIAPRSYLLIPRRIILLILRFGSSGSRSEGFCNRLTGSGFR